jgi:hypothetical protein
MTFNANQLYANGVSLNSTAEFKAFWFCKSLLELVRVSVTNGEYLFTLKRKSIFSHSKFN